ncbi:MAG TPA: prolipoprotein diacylglyceryl transferase [Blastocatellia bacterium]|nr:prolipoprotein diacylglyceryl transferase [Blastocatellia bacterium]
MFPELFKIPGINFTLNTYGLLMAVSFIVGFYVMSRLAGRDGLDRNRVYDLGLWVLAASLVGSKALMVITEWDDYYRDNPGQIFSLDFFRSAGVFYGGFIGAVIASVIVMRIYKLPWWRTADAFAPGIAIGQTIGRLGCFSAGCCWGKPTTAFCGVHFSERGHEVTGVPTVVGHLTDGAQREVWSQKLGGLLAPLRLHPTQLYEAGATLVIFGVLMWMSRRRRFEGQIVLAYAAMYAVARFVIEFWRDDPRGALLGLSTSQFIAIVVFAGAIALLIQRTRHPKPLVKTEEQRAS